MIEGWNPNEMRISQPKSTKALITSTTLSVGGGVGAYASITATVYSANLVPKVAVITVGAGGGFGLKTSFAPGRSTSGFNSFDYSSLDDLEKLRDLEGLGVNVGGALSYLSYDVYLDPTSNYKYDSFGVSAEAGVDFHCLITYTIVVWLDSTEYKDNGIINRGNNLYL